MCVQLLRCVFIVMSHQIPHQSHAWLAEILKISKSNVEIQLYLLVMLISFMFGLHINGKYLLDCIFAHDSLLKHKENVHFKNKL